MFSEKVKTAASNQYEQTLKSEMAKSDAPTLFQINGPVGYQSWKEYCADLKDTEFYNMLVDKDLCDHRRGWRIRHSVCRRRLRHYL